MAREKMQRYLAKPQKKRERQAYQRKYMARKRKWARA
jgi:hypothetical protein